MDLSCGMLAMRYSLGEVWAMTGILASVGALDPVLKRLCLRRLLTTVTDSDSPVAANGI
jgi:hypothetical protein